MQEKQLCIPPKDGGFTAHSVMVGFEAPQEILTGLRISQKAFTNYARKILALDLYKNRHIPLGYCAELANTSKEDFIKFLGENEVSVFGFENEEEFAEELSNA